MVRQRRQEQLPQDKKEHFGAHLTETRDRETYVGQIIIVIVKRRLKEMIIILTPFTQSMYIHIVITPKIWQKAWHFLMVNVPCLHYDLHCTLRSKTDKINYQIFKCEEVKLSIRTCKQ